MTPPDAGLDALDRAVGRAASASASWRKALSEDPKQATPRLAEHREVAGTQAFEALRGREVVSQDVELRDALCRWIAVLTVRRVTESAEADVALAEADKAAHLLLEPVRLVSFRDTWPGLVASRNAADAQAWLVAASVRGEAVAAARRELLSRQHEAVSRFGFASWAELAGGSAPLTAAAEAFLRDTDDLAEAMRREAQRGERALAGTFVGSVLEALARDAPDGFPARLTLRSLMGMFGTTDEFARGLRLDVTLRPIAGASTFARALGEFGIAFRRAAAQAGRTPFAIAHDAEFVDAHRFGFLFAALAMNPVFHRRGLGVVTRVAKHQSRVLAKTALLHARTIALAPLTAHADAGRFEELTHRVYGQALPQKLRGAFPGLRLDNDARLEALLTTLPLVHDLRERFDEDWFRNPRAWRALRGRASGPARVPAEKAVPSELARAFEEALG